MKGPDNVFSQRSTAAKYQYDRYYKHFFPLIWTRVLCPLATCNGRFKLKDVEISPRFADRMMRYHIFETSDDVVTFCQKNEPCTLQLGAAMPSCKTREQAKALMSAGVSHGKGPFVLDIDISEFDRSGICDCDRRVVCDVCWNTFAPSIRNVTEYFLKDVFGFKGVFAVFSGGRGIHYWVLDERVISLGPDGRTVLFDCIATRLELDPHYELIMERFLRPAYKSNELLVQGVSDAVILSRLYPRYDRAVSVTAYHLKKMPLLLHQTTRNLCIVLPPLHKQHEFKVSTHSLKPDNITVSSIENNIIGIELALKELK